ncbi:MAG: Spx/MgsR family RNA polymerase-binding regulatory protein [Moraxellaceae bacterium]|nr:Spx/MgsR family RNA polymerase-binding regulatory protein [Moraxellaceae bacterium]
MLLIAGIKACDSMKKAFARLDSAGIAYSFQDFKKTPPSAEQLQTWLGALGTDVLVNKRGTTWRQLSDADKAKADQTEALITLLQAKPSLIKRPLLQQDDQVTVGLESALLTAA